MPTVVFDIDDTICWNNSLDKVTLTSNAECIKKLLLTPDHRLYTFVPYFDILLKYLLSMGCCIQFFSAGRASRNFTLLESYLSDSRVFGQESFEQLRAMGHFVIYSRHDLINGKKRLMRDNNHSLNDIILVDDLPSFAEASTGEGAIIQVPAGVWLKNHTYYLLGYFMEYFEYGGSLREFVTSLKHNCGPFPWVPWDIDRMTLRGLQAVRTIRPEAVYYQVVDQLTSSLWNIMSRMDWLQFTRDSPECAVTVSKDIAFCRRLHNVKEECSIS